MESSYQITTRHKRLLADTLTPVGIFQRLRGHYPHSVILESADYHAMHNSFSYIACDEVASFQLDEDVVTQKFPDGMSETFSLKNRKDGVKVLQEFAERFENPKSEFPFITNGLFGHITYDSVEYFEDIEIQEKSVESAIPQILYRVYRYVIAINHFKDELYIFEHTYTPEDQEPKVSVDGLETLEFFVKNPKMSTAKFKAEKEEVSNLNDDEMRIIINKCIGHCLRGDVFQIVPTRRSARRAC